MPDRLLLGRCGIISIDFSLKIMKLFCFARLVPATGSQDTYYGKHCELGGINQFEIISMIRVGRVLKNRCFVMILDELRRVWVQINFDFFRGFFMIAATRDFFFSMQNK